MWPARYPSERLQEALGDRLAPQIQDSLERDESLRGRPTDPQRFDDDELLKREMGYGKSGFALQFQLDTSLSDADRYPLKLSDLVVMDTDPKLAPQKIIGSSDPEHSWGGELPCVGLSGDRYYRPRYVEKEWVPYTCLLYTSDAADE